MYTLLQIVQSILNDMDSEAVNSIGDTAEALQVASVVRDTFLNIVTTRDVPEHQELLKVNAASDLDYPTHFEYPEDVRTIVKLWYENSDGVYKEIKWVNPLDFVYLTDNTVSDYVTVFDKNAGTKLRIANNQDPRFYTSFDNKWIVMNSYDSDVDNTLQESKIRAYGVKTPTFLIEDGHVPDLNDVWQPYLLAESKAVAMDLFKGGASPKIEQAARRQKAYIRNDREKSKRQNNWSAYGR